MQCKLRNQSPFGLSSCKNNFYDCLIIDESHRLVKKMYGDWGCENQVKECIEASLLSIFMIDEDQAVTGIYQAFDFNYKNNFRLYV